jgi:hypothetical protein
MYVACNQGLPDIWKSTNQLNNSMVQSPSWEADSRSLPIP